jgi:hypothetical protein
MSEATVAKRGRGGVVERDDRKRESAQKKEGWGKMVKKWCEPSPWIFLTNNSYNRI